MATSRPKSYQSEDSSASNVQEPEVSYAVSPSGTDTTHPKRKHVDWSTKPGQYTEEEKRHRLKAAVECQAQYTHEEVKLMVATWTR